MRFIIPYLYRRDFIMTHDYWDVAVAFDYQCDVFIEDLQEVGHRATHVLGLGVRDQNGRFLPQIYKDRVIPREMKGDYYEVDGELYIVAYDKPEERSMVGWHHEGGRFSTPEGHQTSVLELRYYIPANLSLATHSRLMRPLTNKTIDVIEPIGLLGQSLGEKAIKAQSRVSTAARKAALGEISLELQGAILINGRLALPRAEPKLLYSEKLEDALISYDDPDEYEEMYLLKNESDVEAIGELGIHSVNNIIKQCYHPNKKDKTPELKM